MLKLFRSNRPAAPTSVVATGGPSASSASDLPMEDEDLEDEDEMDGAEDEDEDETAEGEGEGDDEEEEAAPPAAANSADRIKAILTSEAGRANQGLAEALAFDTKLSAAKCDKLLKASKPAAAATGKRDGLATRLRNEGADRPKVGTGAARVAERTAEDEEIASIVGNAGKIGLAKKKA